MYEHVQALLRSRCPSLTSCKIRVEQANGGAYLAHFELLLPEHQIIVNQEDRNADAALARALEAAQRRLEETAQRDPRLR